MPQVTDSEHFSRAQRFKQVYSRYQQARDLISVGAYVKGSDPETDFAIQHIGNMSQFLQQGLNESAPLNYPDCRRGSAPPSFFVPVNVVPALPPSVAQSPP